MKNNLKLGLVSLLLFSICAVGCTKKQDPVEPQPQEEPQEEVDMTIRSSKGTNGAVTCANYRVSKIGLDTLQNGGNAFDAAVAMSFALGLLEPNASGVGGGGVMTGYNAATDSYVFYNFREFAPGNISYDLYEEESELSMGGLASAVPMQVSGLLDIYDDLSNKELTLAQLLEPTINYADNGFELDSRLSINMTFDNMKKYGPKEALAIYGIYDEKHQDYRKPKRVGDLIKNEGLGKVLKAIAEHGKDGFYDGEVADAIVDTNQAHGGVISKADLTRAKTAVVKTTPLEFTYNGYDIHTSAIPAAGGIVLAEILNMLESYCEDNQTTLKEIGFGTEEYLHLYALASQLAYADKRYYVADNAINPATNKSFISVPVDGLISKEYAKARFNAVYDPTQAFVADLNHDFGGANNANPWDYDTVNTDVQEYLYPTNQQDDGTTSLSVVDKDGNICTITETINTYWGSFVMPEGTGFFLNNQMADFSFNQLSVNRIEPYKSPISSMTPTIISKDGKNVMTVGCPGSATIPTAVCQVIIGVLDFDLDIQEAIQRKRIECLQLNDSDISYLGYEPGTEVDKKLLKMEETPAAWGQDVVDALNGKDYFCCFDGAVTHVYGLTISYDDQGNVKEYMAGADTRKDGKSLAY